LPSPTYTRLTQWYLHPTPFDSSRPRLISIGATQVNSQRLQMDETTAAHGLPTPTRDAAARVHPPPALTVAPSLIFCLHREMCSHGARGSTMSGRSWRLVLYDVSRAQHIVNTLADIVMLNYDWLRQIQGDSLLLIMDILQDVSCRPSFAF
jgi:hypothetical protein